MNNIFNEIATVISNECIAENIYEAYLHSPNISKHSSPGQFINILPSENWANVMRRPMSIASQGNDEISIIYKIFGEGTLQMSRWKKGYNVDLIGPLGNTWSGFKSKFPILIGGGVGIAPIMNLHSYLNDMNIKHSLICGARFKNEHFLEHNPQKNIYLATETEEYGIKGNVIDVLKIILEKEEQSIKLFSCGPHGMMKAIYDYSKKFNYDCNLALETIMACGIGICQGCTIKKQTLLKENTYRNKFALACIDGPVFDIKELSNDF